MLALPSGDTKYKILSIDPGTDTLGVCIIELDVITMVPSIAFVTTLRGVQGARLYPDVENTYGLRKAKQHSHYMTLLDLMLWMRPNSVISESPFLGRFPQAFEALVECLYVIKNAVYDYDPTVSLETIDPPNVKKAVGAPGKGKDKEIVKRHLLKLTTLQNHSGQNLALLDEHSIDAIAVGCYKLSTLGVRIV